ncbi:MAG: hypothetical protein EBV35_09275, partial [Betaproteobacteria bacterium]|nr:hypothetical protein [Betaproteobacteria bacterium]
AATTSAVVVVLPFVPETNTMRRRRESFCRRVGSMASSAASGSRIVSRARANASSSVRRAVAFPAASLVSSSTHTAVAPETRCRPIAFRAGEANTGRQDVDAAAFSDRAIGNIARPNFPDGIAGRPPGPLSKPEGTWSPFNDGLQLDLVAGKVLDALVATGINSCTTTAAGIDNGIQIFPGAVPIYRGSTLIGAIGISGDGVDQDDMIASLGLQRAFLALGGRFGTDPGHAPSAIRSDRLAVPGPGTLRYVQCPQSPFISSQAQNVCNF